jgi:hypothetical protein
LRAAERLAEIVALSPHGFVLAIGAAGSPDEARSADIRGVAIPDIASLIRATAPIASLR